MRKNVLVILLLISFCHSLFAQEVNELPIQFQQFFNNYVLLNPAAAGLENRLEFYLVDKTYTGEFSGVNKICGNINYGLRHDSSEGKKTKHVVGATFYNDKIGSYLGRSRAYLSYCMHIPISSNWRLNAGTALGIVNYYYRASALFPGKSVVTPSGDIGLWLYGKKWNFGIAANQLFSGNVSGYHELVKLTRYYNFNIDRRIFVNSNLQLKPSFWLLYVNKNYYDANIALMSVFQNLFTAGAAYKYQRGYTLFIGIEKISLGNANLKWMVSYYNRFRSSTSYEVQSIEISLLLQRNSVATKSSLGKLEEPTE